MHTRWVSLDGGGTGHSRLTIGCAKREIQPAERVFNNASTPRTRQVALRSAMVLGHAKNSVRG